MQREGKEGQREFLQTPAREMKGNRVLGGGQQDRVRRPQFLELTTFGPLDKSVNISGPVPFPVN